ncbi:MAG TPA: helix-turn-helix transcriptional regulator [Chloroflexota bacterium]
MLTAVAAAPKVKREIARACHAGLDVQTLGVEVVTHLREVVPFGAWCWPTADPSTSLITGAVSVGLSGAAAEGLLRLEYLSADFNKFTDLARRKPPTGVLSEATDGELERSARYREVYASAGLADDLRMALVIDGACWGYLALHRERSAACFAPAEEAFVGDLCEHLAEGVRTGLLISALEHSELPAGPGLLMLAEDDSVLSMNDTAQQWLQEVADVDKPAADGLPFAAYAVAAQLRGLEHAEAPANSASPRARLRLRSGQWCVFHGSRLVGPQSSGDVAILIERVQSPTLPRTILVSYGLTERESQLTQLVLRGLSTAEIAAQLCIAKTTVQDHLKSVFTKVGVRSRREVAARVFAQHYLPHAELGATLGPDGWFAG